MAENASEFKALNDFGVDDLDVEATISRRLLRLLEDIDNGGTPGPRTAEGRAALATSVVAHAVVELEAEIIEMKRSLASG